MAHGVLMENKYPEELLTLISNVTANRPRTVLRHILEHGSITTEELSDLYGYTHPPRAARDVREQGIPLKMQRVSGQSGRSIARYTIDVEDFLLRQAGGSSGRRAFPAGWKRALTMERGFTCEICLSTFQRDIDLQVDHRIPYGVGGDPPLENTQEFMLVCPSCNREKSWRCEHCPNWQQKNVEVCRGCFWATPSSYSHVATNYRSAVMVTFSGSEQEVFHMLEREAQEQGLSVGEVIKNKLHSS